LKTQEPDEFPIRLSLFQEEDGVLIQHLTQFKGKSRSRRIRALLRAGFKAGGNPDAPTTNNVGPHGSPSSPLPTPPAQEVQDIEYVKEIGLNPHSFSFDG